MYSSYGRLRLNKTRFRVLIQTGSENIKNGQNGSKTNYFLKFGTKTNYSSLLDFESAFYFNIKLVAFPISFPTHIKTRQSDNRNSSYDLFNKNISNNYLS